MKTKTLNSILALSALGALTSTGCVFMFGAQNQIEFASESKIEQIAENIITKKDNENVIYETMTLKNGKKYHEAAFFKENRIYLRGILDEDNDGDRDKLIIHKT